MTSSRATISDIIAVVDGRPEIVYDVAAAPGDVRGYIGREIQVLLEGSDFIEALAGFLLPDPASQARRGLLETRLRSLSSPGVDGHVDQPRRPPASDTCRTATRASRMALKNVVPNSRSSEEGMTRRRKSLAGYSGRFPQLARASASERQHDRHRAERRRGEIRLRPEVRINN